MSKLYKSTKFIPFSEIEHLTSELFNQRFAAISTDIENIINKINDVLVNLQEDLPQSDLTLYPFDGTNIYVDSNANETQYGGLLYDSEEGKPATIKDVLLSTLKILSYIDNGLKEGVSIGDYNSPQNIAASGTYSVPWIYTDGVFKSSLMVKNSDGTTQEIKDFDVTISYSPTNNEIVITNNDATNAIDIFGYIWHPLFTF